MACSEVSILTIQGSECVGDSLVKINSNFDTLGNAACDIYSTINNLYIPGPDDFVSSIIAGDGVLINGEKGVAAVGDATIEVNNSIQFYKYGDFNIVQNSASLLPNIAIEDGSVTNFYRFPYNISNPPTITLETVAMGEKSPLITLYWASSGAAPITVYATNSALNTTTNGRGPIAPNNYVAYTHLVESTAYLGGAFTTVGGTTRRRFAVVDLQSGTQSPSLGFRGSLSSVPGSGSVGQTERDFLNSVGSAGFNRLVRCITTFNIGSKRYLCVGGDFTNAPAGDNSGTTLGQRFCIFDASDNYNCLFSYTFGNSVYCMLSAGQYLYLAGAFRTGRRNDVSTNITMEGLTRIDMSTLQIDTAFTANSISDTEGIFRGGFYASDNNRSIYALEFKNNILYTGGAHYARVGTGSLTSHHRLMGHYTTGSNAGKVIPTWQPILDGTVTILKIDNTANVLYVGGSFTNYKTFSTSNVKRNRVLALNITNVESPALFSLWDPVCNGAVRAIALHDETNINSPVYLGGEFTKVNGSAASRAVALTKPNTGNVDSVLGSWTPMPNTSFLWYTQPGLIRIPPTSPLSGILVNGTFTTLGSFPRYYFGRIGGRGEGSTPSVSAVEWTISGSVVGQGGSLAVDTTLFASAVGDPLPVGLINETSIQMTEEQFVGAEKGDLCRFLIKRPSTNDTYRRDVWFLGASVDFSPQSTTAE